MSRRHDRGNDAEDRALRYLAGRGLDPLARNYRCRGGELDLVLNDNGTLVITEVRYRASSKFGSGAVSVDARKQRRLIYAARHFLMSHPEAQELPVRFDVVAISGDDARTGEIDWIRNAFETDVVSD